MIKFEIKKNSFVNEEFGYDLKALALSFFPEKNCEVVCLDKWLDYNGYPLNIYIDGELILETILPFTYTKNTVKQTVYKVFEAVTKRGLPWGILTGIRPAKIALRMLMKNKENYEIIKSLTREYFLSESKAKLALDVGLREYELTKNFNHDDCYNIYIGIPFCPSICEYCSFSSYAITSYKNKVDAYLDALEKEMIYVSESFSQKTLNTIYVGGGTPTSLNEAQLKRLMDMIHKYLYSDSVCEFCVEAGRPDSITEEKLSILKESKVSRISINPQTMKDETLVRIGRKHTALDIENTFKMARKKGFDNINMDLIVGLYGETLDDFKDTLRRVKNLKPDSVTVHTLVIKRASRMRQLQLDSGKDMEKEDKLIPLLQDEGEMYLRNHGYNPYYMYRQKNKLHSTRNTNQENVAYALLGKECLYNIFIMEELETIVALGSGGSTKVVYPSENRMERIENVKSVDDYILRIDEMIDRKKKFFAQN